MKQKDVCDKTAKQLSLLTSSGTVRIEDPGGRMTKATVLQEDAPPFFTVRTEELRKDKSSDITDAVCSKYRKLLHRKLNNNKETQNNNKET